MNYKEKYLENLRKYEEQKSVLKAEFNEKIKEFSNNFLSKFRRNLVFGFAEGDLYQEMYFKLKPVIMDGISSHSNTELLRECKKLSASIGAEVREMGFQENEISVSSNTHYNIVESCLVCEIRLNDLYNHIGEMKE